MVAHGSFHGIYSWKLQLMEAMEAFTSVDNGNLHGSESTSTYFHGKNPWKQMYSTDFYGNFYGNCSGNVHGSRSKK